MNLNFNPFPILDTKRLTLRQLVLEDAMAIFNYQSDASNFEYVDMSVYTELFQAQTYVETRLKGVSDKKWIIWAIELRESKKMIGTISIWNFNEEFERAELGYGLFKTYRNKGYMQEALKAVLRYGFDEIDLKVIEGYTNERNLPSRALLETNGFRYIKYIDEKGHSGKTVRLSVYEKIDEV